MKKKVEVKPVDKNEIVQIKKVNRPIINSAVEIVIRNIDQENDAYEILKSIKKQKKMIETKRKSITAPLNASLKEVNALFKTLTGPLDEANEHIRAKIVSFHEKREAQAEKKKERLLEEAAEETDTEERQELEDKAEDTEAIVGESQTMKRWTFEIEDIDSVPREFMMLDTKAVNEAIREGVREIEGLKIFQKESIRV